VLLGGFVPTIGTIARALLGSRSAILSIAASRWSLLIGAVLVLAGGLARNYDGLWIPAEWPALLHGITVSTGNSFLLFTLVWVAGRAWKQGVPFLRDQLAFLGLFWMTAPMAWVYGIPYERFLAPVDAMHANMISLACVSVWRVLLMARGLSVLFGVPMRRTFWLVMLFADAVLLLALSLAPLPVFDLMGGMQQTPHDRELASTAFLAGFIGVLSLPVWLMGACWASSGLYATWQVPVCTPTAPSPPPRAAIACAFLALAFWIAMAMIVQPEQRRRFAADAMLRSGRVADALVEMSTHQRSDYPPMWDPPPRPSWHINEPSIDRLREGLSSGKFAPWVEAIFWEKCWLDLRRGVFRWTAVADWGRFVSNAPPEPEWWVALSLHAQHDPRLTLEERSALAALLDAHDAAARK
jgi:hypothetical protein